jgi:predicted deacylase
MELKKVVSFILTYLILNMAILTLAAEVKVPAGKPPAHDILPGPGVTKIRSLSDYHPGLRKTPGDTKVYILQGTEPGGTVLVAGGTHGNEIAGIAAATLLAEHAQVQKGRLIVVPHANNSAVSYPDTRLSSVTRVYLPTVRGNKEFLFGSRFTKPEHQGEKDPPQFRHPQSNDLLDGREARNLDRAYPGVADGNLTQRIAYGILQLLKKESVDVAFDLHEAGPESRLAWMVVANPKNIETAALAVINLDAAGIPMKLEPSSETFRGLSHREWGDATKAQCFLFETPNPAQMQNRSSVDMVNDAKYPLSKRVGVQLSTLLAILEAYNEQASPQLTIKLLDVPGLPEITKSGLGSFFK